ncbi:hypothetical protein C5167_004288 [Papaver somniferum]|nr:hypothetical protein C5167_004288 [Papaver somniferum]
MHNQLMFNLNLIQSKMKFCFLSFVSPKGLEGIKEHHGYPRGCPYEAKNVVDEESLFSMVQVYGSRKIRKCSCAGKFVIGYTNTTCTIHGLCKLVDKEIPVPLVTNGWIQMLKRVDKQEEQRKCQHL